MSPLGARAAELLDATLARERPLHGGDLNEVIRLETGEGRVAVAKSGPTARAEAAMLGAIAASGAPAPEVLAVADDLLILEDLGDDEGPAAAWEDLGRALARLHAARGETYGWPTDHSFGSVAIPNAEAGDWPSFWGERRLLPSCPEIAPDLARRIERLVPRLPDLLPAHPAPALLHGDLWSGNVLARGGVVTGLIDPACYYGHAEVDLAMLTLFASPSEGFRRGYGPLEPGAAERRPLYQLWPALVHLRLFGAGFRGLVERCLTAVE